MRFTGILRFVELGSHIYAVILAGGEGVRFAPLSTPERPKQFLTIFGDRTLLQHTVDRFKGVIPPQRIMVTTNVRYEAMVREQLPGVPAANILLETAKRNTAPAIALAAHLLRARDPEAVMIVLPADHIIFDRHDFLECLGTAVDLAVRERALVTLGIAPTMPSTAYGYIQHGEAVPDAARPAYRVARFVEKPNVETAERYCADGGYYWNSGMFIWQAETILEEVEKYLPRMAAGLGRPDFFSRADAISIDYSVMERSDRVLTIPCDFGWSDIGSWDSLRALVEREGLDLHPDVKRHLDALA